MTDVPITAARSIRRRRRRWPIVAAACFALLLGAAATALLVRTLEYRHQTMPGVRLFGADVGGRGGAALERRIQAVVGARLARPVTVFVGKKKLHVRPGWLLAVNVGATADRAMHAGQGSFLARSWTLLPLLTPHHDVVPVLRIRRVAAGAFLANLRKLGRAPVDAKVKIEGVRPVVSPARPGTAPLGNRLLDALEDEVLAGGNSVRVAFRTEPPRIATLAAKVAAAEASTFLSAPVVARFRGDAVGSLAPDRLATLLRFHPQGAGYAVSFDRRGLLQALEPTVAKFEREPKDASFAVDGDSVDVVPSEPGWRLDESQAIGAVTAAARRISGRDAPLALRVVQPELTTQKAQALGIRQPIVSFTTELGASSANRIHNVHLMADFIDGTVIRPGETFSFNRVVGPRTAERGFLEGQQIFGSLTLPAIGGGVCQTATTLFNDAFEAGLPVLERHNHGYYLSHYPLGRDATVSYGGPDLVFRNDLNHGILIKSSYTDATLTFTFYGTLQGRTVASTTSPKTNFTYPKMTYAVDRSASPGSVQVVAGSGEQGFDVTVYRTVTQNGTVIRKDSFFSRYIPVGPTTIYGPGRTPPGPYIVLPPPD